MIRWGQPELLWTLLAWAALAWLAFALLRRRERRLAELTDPAVWPVLIPQRHPGRARLRLVLWLAAVAFGLLALARPQWGFTWQEVKRRGLNVMVVLDTSNSMRAGDLKPDRLQQAKWGVRDLVKKLKGDRIGLVAFAGASYLQCPLTVDYAAFLMTLEDVYCGVIPRGGTAITQALRTAMEKFDPAAEADRVIVLITDGEDHEGNPLSLTDDLKARGIRVYAVGVGTPDGELLPAEDAPGGLRKDAQGNVIKSALHEDTLQKLAISTGGAYVRAAPGDFGLDRLYDQGIAKLRRAEQESRMARQYEERAGWFVGIALFLLALEAAMAEKRKARP